MGNIVHPRPASRRLFAALSLVLVYGLLAVHLASAEALYHAGYGLSASTFMSASGSSPTYYRSVASSSSSYVSDSNYTYIAGYNNSSASGWHFVDDDNCGFTSGVTSSCSTAPVTAGSSQDNATERRTSTRHSYWWSTDGYEIYTSARFVAGGSITQMEFVPATTASTTLSASTFCGQRGSANGLNSATLAVSKRKGRGMSRPLCR